MSATTFADGGTGLSLPKRREPWWGWAVSVGLHLVLIVFFLVVSGKSAPKIDLDRAVIKTKLVKLGKKRDEKLLPRVDVQKAPPPAPKAVANTPQPTVAEKKEKPKVTDRDSAMKDALAKVKSENTDESSLSDLINKRLGNPSDEGHEEGSALGDSITGRLRATYNDKLAAMIRRAYEMPNTLTDEERVRLKTVVEMRIGDVGNLISAKIIKSSGNDLADNAVLKATKTAALPTPPLTERAFYAAGIQIEFCPVSCD